MKIRYSILSAIFALLTLTASAQSYYGTAIGARGGLTIPQISPAGKKTPLSEGYKSRMAWGAGAFADFRFTPAFSLQIGVEYSSQGGKKDGSQAIPSSEMIAPMMSRMESGLADIAAQMASAGNVLGAGQVGQFGAALAPLAGQMPQYLYADFESEAKFNYLMVPVQVKWGWNLSPTSPLRIYVGAGVFGSYLLSAEQVMSGKSVVFADKDRMTPLSNAMGAAFDGALTSVSDLYARGALSEFIAIAKSDMSQTQDFNRTKDIYDELKKFNYGFIGHLGIQYSSGRNNFFIEGGGNYGLVEIQKEDVNGQNRIGAGSVMIGYSRVIGRMRSRAELF